MASIRQLPSGLFNVQIRHKNADPISRSFPTREDAERWANEHDPSPRGKSEGDGVVPLSFLALGKRYCNTVLKGHSSQPITLGRVERIASHLPSDARAITKNDVNRYRLMRLQEVAPATCRLELQIINRVFRWAHREMMLDRTLNPSPCTDIPMPPPSKPRSKVVSRDELDLLLSVLSPTMRIIVELAFETAMRRSEIIKLTPKLLHLKERVLSVIDGKAGDRSVPLTRRAVKLLRAASKGCATPDTRLFPVTPHSVSTAVRRARQKMGLDQDVRLHQLRHTRISVVAKQGFNQAQIMMVSGHRDIRSVQRYTHLNVMDVVRLLD